MTLWTAVKSKKWQSVSVMVVPERGVQVKVVPEQGVQAKDVLVGHAKEVTAPNQSVLDLLSDFEQKKPIADTASRLAKFDFGGPAAVACQ